MKAVIFDMDGLLIDSEPLWKIAEIEGFKKVGINLTQTDCEETVGLRMDEVTRIWYNKVGWKNKTVEEVTEDVIDILIREIKIQGKALPGVYGILEDLKKEGYKIGLATSSYQRIIHAVLEKLSIAEYFDEALEQTKVAMQKMHNKPIFLYYHTAVLFALGKTKEALLHLEDALLQAPKLLKKFVELNPSILQNQLVVDVLAKFKRKLDSR